MWFQLSLLLATHISLTMRPQAKPLSTWYKWLLVTLTCVQVLTAAGAVFGWSALVLALQRDGVYSEHCEKAHTISTARILRFPGAGPGKPSASSKLYSVSDSLANTEEEPPKQCSASLLHLHDVYSTGIIAIGIAIIVWGFILDAYGSIVVRFLGCLLFAIGSFLFAVSNSQTFDMYAPAMGLIGTGGAAILISSFVIAEHFEGNTILIHTLINTVCSPMQNLSASHTCDVCASSMGLIGMRRLTVACIMIARYYFSVDSVLRR